jgi:hypothetical protein
MKSILSRGLIAVLVGLGAFFAAGTAHGQVLPPSRGGTGTSTAPTYGKVLVGNAAGTYTLTATSSLGLAAGGVSSVFSRTGAVAAQAGDYTSAMVTELNNLYFTNARALAATLAGFVSGAGSLSPSDTILTAIQKLDANIAAKLGNITGLVTAGTNVSLTGSGTSGSPYVVNSTAGGGTPGGASSTVQYNAGGAFAGNSGLTYNGSYLGIGTSSPQRLLTLTNTGTTNQLLFEDAAAIPNQHYGSFGFSRGVFNINTLTDALATTSRLTIDSNGNAGIASSSPWALLSVNPVAGTGATPAFAIGSSSATNFVVTNAGRVGVGTSSPMSAFAVTGREDHYGNYYHFGSAAPTFSCVSQSCIDLWGTDNTTAGVGYYTGNTSNGTAAYSGYNLYNDKADSNVTNFAGMFLNSSTYADSSFGAAIAVPYLFLIQNSMGPTSIVTSTSTASGLGYTNFLNGGTAAANETMRITQSGRLGLGTTSPYGLLSINPTATLGATPQFVIGSSSATSVVVTNAGNVGIGTLTPTAPLDIENGNVKIAGLTINPSNGGTTFSQTFAIKLTTANALILTSGLGDPVSILNYSGNSTIALRGSVDDLFLRRDGAAMLRLGAADSATPIAQTIKVQDVLTGTTNGSGANFAITGSRGTGTGVGGSILFQTAPAGLTGTAQNATSTAMTILGSGLVGIGTTTPTALLSVGADTQLNANYAFAVGSSTQTSLGVNNAGNVVFKGVVSTGVTGTGNIVLSSSPALVTPTAAAYRGGTASTAFMILQGTSNAAQTTGGHIDLQPAGGVETARFLSTGRLGIGTTTPTAELQVATTTANATSTLEVGKAGQNKGSCLLLYDVLGAPQYVSIVAGAFTVSTNTCK